MPEMALEITETDYAVLEVVEELAIQMEIKPDSCHNTDTQKIKF